jgi:hypothetical protein
LERKLEEFKERLTLRPEFEEDAESSVQADLEATTERAVSKGKDVVIVTMLFNSITRRARRMR